MKNNSIRDIMFPKAGPKTQAFNREYGFLVARLVLGLIAFTFIVQVTGHLNHIPFHFCLCVSVLMGRIAFFQQKRMESIREICVEVYKTARRADEGVRHYKVFIKLQAGLAIFFGFVAVVLFFVNF